MTAQERHDIAAELHGRWSGYVKHGCRCAACVGYKYQVRLRSAERFLHNARIIEDMKQKRLEPPKPVKRRAPRKPATKAAAKPNVAVLKERVPPVTPAVRERITDLATLQALSETYFDPEWSSPLPNGREQRARGEMMIIVGEVDQSIIGFETREVGTGSSELLVDRKAPLPKAKGGGIGRTGPTTMKDLVAALEKSGCTIEKTGSGHVKVSKNGKSTILPSTASDWRALKNAVSHAKREGLL